ncbi:MAG: DUF2200 family protein [Sporolactobacillus sp.]
MTDIIGNLTDNVDKIKKVICGFQVKKIKSLDKLVDELARSAAMEKILSS